MRPNKYQLICMWLGAIIIVWLSLRPERGRWVSHCFAIIVATTVLVITFSDAEKVKDIARSIIKPTIKTLKYILIVAIFAAIMTAVAVITSLLVGKYTETKQPRTLSELFPETEDRRPKKTILSDLFPEKPRGETAGDLLRARTKQEKPDPNNLTSDYDGDFD